MCDHVDSVRAVLKNERELLEMAERSRDYWRTHAQVWEGKFHAVKRENKAMRKKLYPNK